MATARKIRRTAQSPFVTDSRICGGEPTVEGTRVPVRCIVVEHQLTGDLAKVSRAFPQLEPWIIRAALQYYEEHRAEIDEAIDRQERAASAID